MNLAVRSVELYEKIVVLKVADPAQGACVLAKAPSFFKGYLSHQHRIAVLSKQDSFPHLSAATLTDPCSAGFALR